LIAFAFAGSSIQLVPDGTLLLHLALIVAMVALLNATLLKPINRILEERERRTKGRFKEAQILLSAVSEKLREYESRMREARARGYQLLESERTAATGERERKVSEVKAEVTRWLDEEKRRLQTDEEQIRARLQKDAQERALEIGSHILGRPVRQTERL
jgi:F-type H+-transporting ATPase subunit b